MISFDLDKMMTIAEWHPIESAPRDGTIVRVGKRPQQAWRAPPYPIRAKWDGQQWVAQFSGTWAPFEPQPDVWQRSD